MDILRAGDQDKWNKNNLSVNINFNYTCNFSCSYCYNKIRRKTKINKILDINIVKTFIDDIMSLNYDSYNFAIAGGEPTLYKNFYDFYLHLELSKIKNCTVYLSTNGSLIDKLIPCIENCKNINKVFMVSLHEEQKSIDEYKQIFENFKYLSSLSVKYVVPPNSLNKAIEFKNYCENIGLDFCFQTIDVAGLIHPDYTQEEIKFIDSYAEKQFLFRDILVDNKIETINFNRNDYLCNKELRNFKDMYCLAGFSNMNISPEGLVYRCFRDLTGIEFSLYENSILQYPNLLKIKTCKSDICDCAAVIGTPKWKAGVNPPSFIDSNKIDNLTY